MPIQLIGYVALFVLTSIFYFGLLAEVRWQGASMFVFAVLFGAFAITLAVPYVASAIGAPPLLAAAGAAGPALLVAVSFQWLIRRTGGPRPEVRLLYAFRRINRIGEGQPTGTRKRAGDNARLLRELDGLEALRTPRTTRLIDALEVINRSWIESEMIPPVENDARYAELRNAADELWGAEWRRRR